MDEHEIIAFELLLDLNKSRRKYPRSERYEATLIKSIAVHRALSKTYHTPYGA